MVLVEACVRTLKSKGRVIMQADYQWLSLLIFIPKNMIVKKTVERCGTEITGQILGHNFPYGEQLLMRQELSKELL